MNNSIYHLSSHWSIKLLNYCEEQQFYPLISFTAPRIENLLEMVNTNNGVALIMEQQANYYVTSPLKIVQLNSPIKLYINVNVHNHLIASKEVAYLLELAKSTETNFKQILSRDLRCTSSSNLEWFMRSIRIDMLLICD